MNLTKEAVIKMFQASEDQNLTGKAWEKHKARAEKLVEINSDEEVQRFLLSMFAGLAKEHGVKSDDIKPEARRKVIEMVLSAFNVGMDIGIRAYEDTLLTTAN